MDLDVAIVLPARNEGASIAKTVSRLVETLDSKSVSANLIVVLDGPDPAAKQAIERLNLTTVQILELTYSVGKGAALRFGCKETKSKLTAFFDSDLDIHPNSLVNCYNVIGSSSAQVVCAYGSKHHIESQLSYPILRRFGSRVFHYLVQLLFNIRCNDTQTGVKVFRTNELLNVIDQTREDRFLFDLELLVLLGKVGGRFVEAPVEITYQYSSTINLISATQMLIDVFRMRARLARQPRHVGS